MRWLGQFLACPSAFCLAESLADMSMLTKKDVNAISLDRQDELRERIRALAHRVGSVSELARRASLSQATVAAYVNRGSEPSTSALVRLARAGEVSISWLATGAEEINPAPNGVKSSPKTTKVASGKAQICYDAELLIAVATAVLRRFPHRKAEEMAQLIELLYRLVGDEIDLSHARGPKSKQDTIATVLRRLVA